MERWPVLLVFLAGATSVLAEGEFPTKEFLEHIQPVVLRCEEKTGVNKGLVEKFSKGHMVDDPKLKCYMKCIFLEFDVLDETTGQFKYEKMFSLIPQEMRVIAFDMGKNCIHFKGEGGSDLCQVSYDLHQCWQKSDPKKTSAEITSQEQDKIDVRIFDVDKLRKFFTDGNKILHYFLM